LQKIKIFAAICQNLQKALLSIPKISQTQSAHFSSLGIQKAFAQIAAVKA